MSKQSGLFNEMSTSGAVFSQDRKYRYVLWREWDPNLPKIMFIGLNPSTADANMDDPTIRRVKRFAKDWGYGGVYMMNLFAIISTDPRILLEQSNDPIGDNDSYLADYRDRMVKDVLFAWGSFPQAKFRAAEVAAMFPRAVCLGLTKDGSPKHPLYVAAKTKHVNFK